MASIKLVLRSDKFNKKTNEAPLYIRVIKDRKTKFSSLGIKLDPKHWNIEQQKVRKSYKNSARMNAFLAEKVAEAESKILEETTKNKNISTNDLKEAIIGKEPAKFFDYAYSCIERQKPTYSISTYHNYFRYLKKFRPVQLNYTYAVNLKSI